MKISQQNTSLSEKSYNFAYGNMLNDDSSYLQSW